MSNFLTYTAVIETDSGVLKFEFETDETTVGGITATAIDIAKETIDEASVMISGGILKKFQLK
jgi:hypothetical protein